MAKLDGTIDAPILAVIAKELLALLRSDAALRELQGANAARACYFAAGTVTNAVAQVINEANAGTGEIFFQLVVVFDITAGAGNYRIDGPAPGTALGTGLPIPSGGGTLTITGHDNIRNFSMIAQGAVTLPFARYLFK
jgi:hypothetical protein